MSKPTHADETEKAAAGGVNALERGLRLVMLLGQHGGLTLSELSRSAGLNKTTALRLLTSLERYAFTHRGPDQRYGLGPALFALTSGHRQSDWVRHAVAPRLAALAAKTGETAAVFVLHGTERLCVACASGWHAISHKLEVGDRLPLSAGASADVLKAFATGRPANFTSELQCSFGARTPELAAMAAPLFGVDGKLLGALSLSGTCTRFQDDAYLKDLRANFSETVSDINRVLAMERAGSRVAGTLP